MFNKILLLSLSTFITNAYAEDCKLTHFENGQKHTVCQIEGKDFHFLDIHGSMKDVAFYHGKFLAPFMRQGVLQSVLDRRDESLAAMSDKDRSQFQSVYSCIMNRYERSVGDDMIDEYKALARGSRAGGANVSDKDVIEASLMIELSGYVDSLMLEMEQNKTKATLELFSRCGLNLTANAAKGLLVKLSRPLRNVKMGCTGFVAGDKYTSAGQQIHGRNFDSGFLGVFEKYPVVLRHTPDHGIPYVGMSTVGLHYSGGISGMNESGLSISTHELRTSNYRTLYPLRLDLNPFNFKLLKRKSAATAPYLANKILKEAKTIDEAVALVKKTGNFGAWSFLISDAKTKEAASIEISGDVVRVAKRVKGHMAQTNHFLHPDTKKDNFEYSINKSLESRARLSLVEKTLKADNGNIDIQWGVDLLSGHEDYDMGLRSFGRTVSKVYTSMTHVMDTKNKEFWFSLGNDYPTNMTSFVGMKIDFKTNKDYFTFVGKIEGQKELKETMPNFVSSLRDYTMAYFSNVSRGHSVEGLTETLEYLETAKTKALMDGFSDYPTQMMISKTALKLYAYSENPVYLERADKELTEIYTSTFTDLHTFEQSQVMAEIGKVYALRKGQALVSQKYFKEAQRLLLPLKKQFPEHFFLEKLSREMAGYENKGITMDEIKEIELHFETVE